MTSEYRHIPVLLPECMKYLKLSAGKTYVDATLGGAGHSLEAAKLIGPTGHLLGIDQDDVARAAASERLAALPDEVRPKVDVLAASHCGSVTETLRIWKSCDDYPQQLLRNV